MIVDTSVLIDLMKQDPKALGKVGMLEDGGIELRIPTPALFELWRGVHLAATSAEEESRVREVVGPYPVAPLDTAAAERGGKADARLIGEGLQIDPEDAMIAGIAMARNEGLLTGNVKHFSRVKGLHVEGY